MVEILYVWADYFGHSQGWRLAHFVPSTSLQHVLISPSVRKDHYLISPNVRKDHYSEKGPL